MHQSLQHRTCSAICWWYHSTFSVIYWYTNKRHIYCIYIVLYSPYMCKPILAATSASSTQIATNMPTICKPFVICANDCLMCLMCLFLQRTARWYGYWCHPAIDQKHLEKKKTPPPERKTGPGVLFSRWFFLSRPIRRSVGSISRPFRHPLQRTAALVAVLVWHGFLPMSGAAGQQGVAWVFGGSVGFPAQEIWLQGREFGATRFWCLSEYVCQPTVCSTIFKP